MTRVLLVGAGSVARRHASVLADLGAVVVAVADPDAGAAHALASTVAAATFSSAEEALAAVEVDAVHVCVPPFAHGAPERAAIARGLPLFVEKPLAADLGTAEQLAAEVAARGILTATGYHWRCLDVLPRVRAVLAQAPAVLATGSWMGATPPAAWWSERTRSGGQVVEQLTHVLDLARVLLGEPQEVHAASDRRGRGTDDVDAATAAVVRFGSGTVATFAATHVLDARYDASLRLFAPGVSLELTESGLTLRRGAREEVQPVREDPRVTVDRDFLEAVRDGRPTTAAPYADALETHRLAVAIAGAPAPGDAAVRPVPTGSRRPVG